MKIIIIRLILIRLRNNVYLPRTVRDKQNAQCRLPACFGKEKITHANLLLVSKRPLKPMPSEKGGALCVHE
jgi:hypothetical protein